MMKKSEVMEARGAAARLPDFYAPVVTAFRAETGIVLAEGASDNADGAFAWWCMRNVWALERHGLYQEHPAATVLKAYVEGSLPQCVLVQAPPPDHERVYFPDDESRAAWDGFLTAGGAAGASLAAWNAVMVPKQPSPRRSAS